MTPEGISDEPFDLSNVMCSYHSPSGNDTPVAKLGAFQ